MLKYDWALVNLHIDNLILLRNGWNNTRFLCIKVDLRVLSGSRRLLLPAAGPGRPYAGRWCRTGGSKLYKGLGDLCNIFILNKASCLCKQSESSPCCQQPFSIFILVLVNEVGQSLTVTFPQLHRRASQWLKSRNNTHQRRRMKQEYRS